MPSLFRRLSQWFPKLGQGTIKNPADRKIVEQFSRELDRAEKQIPMRHGYARLEPYIIDTHQAGIDFRFIVYHAESKNWFDNQNIDPHLLMVEQDNLVREGDVVFDLGCNSGFMTSWYAKKTGPTGKVLAFDPFPWNTLATFYTGKLNGLNNIQVHTIGIADRTATLRIPMNDSKIYANRQVAAKNTFDAVLEPLDKFSSYKPNFIKVDIEGAERDLLAGATKIRSQIPAPIWLLEMHHEFIEAAGHNPGKVAEDFEKFGFICRIGHPQKGERFDKKKGLLPRHCSLFALPKEVEQSLSSKRAA